MEIYKPKREKESIKTSYRKNVRFLLWRDNDLKYIDSMR